MKVSEIADLHDEHQGLLWVARQALSDLEKIKDGFTPSTLTPYIWAGKIISNEDANILTTNHRKTAHRLNNTARLAILGETYARLAEIEAQFAELGLEFESLGE